MYYCAAIDKYITCARDGIFRLWQGGDLEYVKTVNNGSSWITDCMYLPQSRKMVFTTMDRAITYYDIARWARCRGCLPGAATVIWAPGACACVAPIFEVCPAAAELLVSQYTTLKHPRQLTQSHTARTADAQNRPACTSRMPAPMPVVL